MVKLEDFLSKYKKFDSVNEASEYYGIPRRSISNVLSGTRNRVYGKEFAYDERG